jgi:tetratricopeptide (TPR) repeat protein
VFRFLICHTIAVLALSLMAGCRTDPEAQKQEYFRNGERLAAEKNFQAAIVEYRNAIQQDERFGRARFRLAQAYVEVHDWPRARAEFIRAADLLPEDVDVQVAAALTLLRSGEFQDAKSRAEVALKLDPKRVEAYLVFGGAAAGLREFDDAIRSFEDGLVADPNRAELHMNMGAVKILQGNLAAAEGSFQQAVALSPQSVPARLALANFYWGAARAADAEQAIAGAIAVEPTNVAANRALASLYMASNRQAEAEAPLRRAADGSGDAQPSLMLSDYLVQQRRHSEAAAILDKIIARGGRFAPAEARRAEIEYQLGRREQAYKRVDDILANQPRNADVLSLKGRWLLAERKSDAALEAAQAAVAADPSYWPAHDVLGSVYVLRHQPELAKAAFVEAVRLNPRAVHPQIALSELNVIEGKTDAGIEFAQEAVYSAPTSGIARFALARALVATGDLKRARSELQPILLGSPKSAQVQALLGTIEERDGNIAAAKSAFERAVALDANTIDAVAGLVRLDTAAKNIPQAVARVQEYVKGAAEDPQAFYLAAQTYISAGDFGQAEMALRKAIELNGSFTQAYHRLGRLYVQQEKMDDARKVYDRLVEQRPNDVTANSMLALLLHSQQNYPEAKRVYERILAIDSRAAVAANNLAYIYAEDGENLDVALALAQTAKMGRPNDPDVNDTLGFVYLRREMPAMAKDPLEQSVRANPRNALYQYHLGLTYLKLGETAKGRAALLEVLRLEPQFEKAADVRKALAESQ